MNNSEPLYVIGAGDLGTSASKVDTSLSAILKISASWGAVVLIDEADVFLEERALHHLERNAMVAVFLRHLEYVPYHPWASHIKYNHVQILSRHPVPDNKPCSCL